jgi:hypothetical protein
MYALHAAKKLASGFKSFGEWYKYNKRSVASSVPGIAGAAAALLLIGIVASGIKSCVRNDSLQADNRYKAAIEAVSSVDSNTYVVAVSKNDVAYLRINSLLSSNAVPDRIKLPIEVNTLLGSHDGKIFYYGIEERQDADTGQGKYPQICVYDLNTRTVSNMVDYSSREARWTKDSQVAAGMLAQKDDGTVKPLLQIPRGFSKNWYEVKTNTLVEADSCKLLQVQHPRALGTTGMSIDKDSYGKVCIYSAEGKHMATANMEALAVFMHSVTNKP